MTISKDLEKIIDFGGIFISLIVDCALNIICFYILAPNILTSIAFVLIGVMCVLFIFRSWSKGQKKTWLVFVIVVFFFDLSFTLQATKTQSNNITTENDTELSRIDSDIASEKTSLDDLRAQYKQAMQRATMDQINNQIIISQSKIDQYENDRKLRLLAISSGRIIRDPITADSIFSAIPQAIIDRRIIQLIIFALIFVGLQLIIASSIDSKHKLDISEPVIEPDEPMAPVERPSGINEGHVREFVLRSWYKIRQNTSDCILSEDVFFDFIKRQNKVYDRDIYRYLVQLCLELGIIDKKGVAQSKDEQEISRIMLTNCLS